MTRTRASAKAAGTHMESLVVAYLQAHVDRVIERRRLSGSKDRGDVSGLRHLGQRVVVECKNTARWTPSTWLAETELQRGNDDAGVGLVVAKRIGKGDPAEQVVLMTLRDFVSLLTGTRPEET